jgi:acyl-CoA thioesterase II
MGDLSVDTALEQVDEGRFRAVLGGDWEVFGPMGGYLAALALRAAGEVSQFPRPASFFCQYLRSARFDEVTLDVASLRVGRTASSLRVRMEQRGRQILEATIWTVEPSELLEHHVADAPDVPAPETLPHMKDRFKRPPPPSPFWNNVEPRPVDWPEDWPPQGPLDPSWVSWYRLQPTATFDDPWLDAGRLAILIDVQGWPAALRPHHWKTPPVVAPSLDLYVAFHESAQDAEWLLADGHAPVAHDGLIGWNGKLWSQKGRLVASGGGQLMCTSLLA